MRKIAEIFKISVESNCSTTLGVPLGKNTVIAVDRVVVLL